MREVRDVLHANSLGQYETPSDITDHLLDLLALRMEQRHAEQGLPLDKVQQFACTMTSFDELFTLFMKTLDGADPELAAWIEAGLDDTFEHPADSEDPSLYV